MATPQEGGSRCPPHTPRWESRLLSQLVERNKHINRWAARWTVPGKPPVKSTSSAAPAAASSSTPCLHDATLGLLTCVACGEGFPRSEGLHLMCGAVDHWHCFLCLEESACEMMRLLLRKKAFDIDGVYNLFPGMVLCAACRHPTLLSVKVREEAADPSRPFAVSYAKCIQLDRRATNALSYHVEIIEQNERRSWAGKFGKDNLFFADYRGPWSTEDGDNEPRGKHGVRCPNASYHWIGCWVVEKTGRTDGKGWQYATTWPGSGAVARWFRARWIADPSPLRFVRRRRWLRLRLRLSDDDVLLLQMHRTPCPYWEHVLRIIEEEEF